MSDTMLTRAQACEEAENAGSNPSDNPSIGDLIAARYHRRDILKGALGVAAIAATVSPLAIAAAQKAQAAVTSFPFTEVTAGVDERHHVAAGYNADILVRWGDPVLPGAPAFNPAQQNAAAQKTQFGYNNDYLGYLPMPGAANPSQHGLLVVNHEYTNEELMFAGLGRQDVKAVAFAKMTKELVDIEKAAHGGAVIEVKRDNGQWRVVADSKYARRIDADTVMEVTGPAAGSDRLKTKADPSGRRVLGMLNNCAGGLTPWGTWLSCEENFNGYFWGKVADDDPQAAAFKRYGVPGNWYNWGAFEDRFDVTKEPNEANRFGWVVEIDPFDPASTPKKRTAMGRFKHEGAAGIVNKDGRYVIYQGDDERFDYVYRFVTDGKVDPASREANRDLLDAGTLSVARYNADGSGEWLPLVFGQGPLTAANGFKDQADVLIEVRRAADLLGATKMDRPEDADVDPVTQKVYVMLTNNTRRKPDQVDAANPRADNKFGHIIEMMPAGGDHADAKFTWEILVKCGDPAIAEVGATFSSATTKDGWFGMPDNSAIDADGRLWIATDGNNGKATGRTDGLWALETAGEARATSKLFFRCPAGAELCGPAFTPDMETLFVAVQHPGDDGPQWPDFGRPSTFDDPSTRWPDFQPGMPPRPSVVVITRNGGGKIAS
ncbi:MAG: PhoX family phosphatase [Pseudolabrys sp.]|nr:PhoX family phosphatase [Pseudolabrys sp.]